MNPQREKALPRVRHLSKPLVTLLAGVLLGACLMFVGLARAGRLAPPPRPEVLVSLAQTLEVEHRRVDVQLGQRAGDQEFLVRALDDRGDLLHFPLQALR